MSEQPVAPPRRAPSGGGGSWMTRRGGPFNLPNWEWAGFGIAVLIAVFFLLHKKKSTSGGSQAAGVQCPQGYAPDSQGNCVPVSTSSNAVPQFVNQTYSTVNAPTQTTVNEPPETEPAPVPGPPGPAGPPGPPAPPGSTSPPPQPAQGQFAIWQSTPTAGYVYNPTGALPSAPTSPRATPINFNWMNPFSYLPKGTPGALK